MSKPKREIVRGTPIRFGAREVVPEAEIWSWQKMNVTLPHRFDAEAARQPERASGLGACWTWARPTALIEREGERTRRLHIVDRNRQIETLFVIAAVLLPVVLNAAARLARANGSLATPYPRLRGSRGGAPGTSKRAAH